MTHLYQPAADGPRVPLSVPPSQAPAPRRPRPVLLPSLIALLLLLLLPPPLAPFAARRAHCHHRPAVRVPSLPRRPLHRLLPAQQRLLLRLQQLRKRRQAPDLEAGGRGGRQRAGQRIADLGG